MYKLRNAVVETFGNRNTKMSMDSAAFSKDFLNDPIHQTRWKAFLKKKNALIQVSMADAIKQIKTFATPLFNEKPSTVSKWNPERSDWE